MTLRALMVSAAAAACFTGPLHGAESPAGDEAAFRDLYKELVEINTTRSVGSCTRAAEAMRARLAAAGIPAADMQILTPPDRPNDGALIAVLRGRDRRPKPLLLLAHIDVVEAKREDWERDPFKLVEENGWFYARGASDDKAMAAVFTDSLVRYAREGFKPRRDIKLALTCGEETPDQFNSVAWLVKTQPAVLDAEFALNEGAGGELDANGKPIALQIQAGEKVYQDFTLSASDVGGHSSRPNHNNPIVRACGRHREARRLQFPGRAQRCDARLSRRRNRSSCPRRWRPTCKACSPIRTMRRPSSDYGRSIRAGTACCAPPASRPRFPAGTPRMRCRSTPKRTSIAAFCPGVPIAAVQEEIVKVLADAKITVAAAGDPGIQSPPPPLTARIIGPVRTVADRIWPGVAIVPTMATGATDGRFLNAHGVPTYGLSGMFHDAEGAHAHGLNERIRVASLMNGRRFFYEIVKIYADQPP